MDNEPNPEEETEKPSNQVGANNNLLSGHHVNIHPSEEVNHELKLSSSEATKSPQPSLQQAPLPNVQLPHTNTTKTQISQSIYPNPTHSSDLNSAAPSIEQPIDNDINQFKLGYKLGTKIFIYQILVGIIFLILNYLMNITFLKSADLGFRFIVNSTISVVILIIYGYIAYSIINKEVNEDSFVLTLLGYPMQILGMYGAFRLLTVLFIQVFSLHVISSVAISFYKFIGWGYLIVLVVLCFFISKLLYGLAFKIKSMINDQQIRYIIGGILSIILLIILGFYEYQTYQVVNRINFIQKEINIQHSSKY